MFRCRLLTPDRTLFEQEVSSISLPTEKGEITVLTNHIPVTSILVPGIIRLKDVNGEEQEIAVSQGFIHVDEQRTVTVLAHTAERGEELDLRSIEEAKKRAEEVMRRAIGKDDAAFASAAAGLQHELARERLATRHRTHRSPLSIKGL